jgi:hypothetical protein
MIEEQDRRLTKKEKKVAAVDKQCIQFSCASSRHRKYRSEGVAAQGYMKRTTGS